MKDFCQNEFCDNPGAKEVSVSANRASDQVRTLCVTCEEVFTWGVQHGTITAHDSHALPHLERFLQANAFVILTHNQGDPSQHGPFEAWAYRGKLDLKTATPVTFGTGKSVQDALQALDGLLARPRRQEDREPEELCAGRSVRV